MHAFGEWRESSDPAMEKACILDASAPPILDEDMRVSITQRLHGLKARLGRQTWSKTMFLVVFHDASRQL